MTFNIVAMICVAGMSPADCGPEPGFSRDKVIVGAVSNEIECLRESEQVLGRVSTFQNLAEGEFIKVMCVRNG
jgi:hypothetical protein